MCCSERPFSSAIPRTSVRKRLRDQGFPSNFGTEWWERVGICWDAEGGVWADAAGAAAGAGEKGKPNKIWSTSTTEERERIKDFWLGLGEEERRSLVKIEKDTVLRKMKEQQKHSCSCAVCGRKRFVHCVSSLRLPFSDVWTICFFVFVFVFGLLSATFCESLTVSVSVLVILSMSFHPDSTASVYILLADHSPPVYLPHYTH